MLSAKGAATPPAQLSPSANGAAISQPRPKAWVQGLPSIRGLKALHKIPMEALIHGHVTHVQTTTYTHQKLFFANSAQNPRVKPIGASKIHLEHFHNMYIARVFPAVFV